MKGIYKLYEEGVLVYIGKSLNIERRVKSHKSKGLFSFDYSIKMELPVEDLNIIEEALIKKYKPKYNQPSNRNKSPIAKNDNCKFIINNCKNCFCEYKAYSLRSKFCSDTCRTKNWESVNNSKIKYNA
jgi:CRISPR/Cas system CMR-associated protein Cmr1 (group 7 of RAMP superfamily)